MKLKRLKNWLVAGCARAVMVAAMAGALGCATDVVTEDVGQTRSTLSERKHVPGGFESVRLEQDDADCQRTIEVTGNTLRVERDGETHEAPLEWSHPDATMLYATDRRVVDEDGGGIARDSGCDDSTGERMVVQASGLRFEAGTAGCGGRVAGLRQHMQTLANDYFPEAACQ